MREWIQPDDQKEQNIKFELLLWFDPFFLLKKIQIFWINLWSLELTINCIGFVENIKIHAKQNSNW